MHEPIRKRHGTVTPTATPTPPATTAAANVTTTAPAETTQPAGPAAGMTPGVVPGSGNPKITILSPQYDSAVPSTDVTIEVLVENFSLTSTYENISSTYDQGRIVYYLDAAPQTALDTKADVLPEGATGSTAISTNVTYTWHNLTPGIHNFSAQLVLTNTTPLDPPAVGIAELIAVGPGATVPPTTASGPILTLGTITPLPTITPLATVTGEVIGGARERHVYRHAHGDAGIVTGQARHAGFPDRSRLFFPQSGCRAFPTTGLCLASMTGRRSADSPPWRNIRRNLPNLRHTEGFSSLSCFSPPHCRLLQQDA